MSLTIDKYLSYFTTEELEERQRLLVKIKHATRRLDELYGMVIKRGDDAQKPATKLMYLDPADGADGMKSRSLS